DRILVAGKASDNTKVIFNDRPGFASSAACGGTTISPTDPNLNCTPLGTFQARPDLAPTPQRILPVNYGMGTAHFVMNLRLTKTFGFGPKTKDATPRQGPGGPGGGGPGGRRGPLFGGGGPREMSAASDRRYNLVLGVSVRNVFNNVNLSDP